MLFVLLTQNLFFLLFRKQGQTPATGNSRENLSSSSSSSGGKSVENILKVS